MSEKVLLLTAGSKKLVVAGMLKKGSAGGNDKVRIDFTAFSNDLGNGQPEMTTHARDEQLGGNH